MLMNDNIIKVEEIQDSLYIPKFIEAIYVNNTLYAGPQSDHYFSFKTFFINEVKTKADIQI